MTRQPLSGFTLIEMILALAVLVVLAAVAVPNAIRIYGDNRLSEAVELVRVQLAGGRIRAIESGLAYQFRYEPSGRWFAVLPFELDDPEVSPTATGTGNTTGVGRLTRFAGELPEGFHFEDGATSAAAQSGGLVNPQELAADAFAGLPNADELSSVGWSAPVVFTADGGAEDRTFEIVDDRQLAVTVRVRGLTGATTLSQRHPGAAR